MVNVIVTSEFLLDDEILLNEVQFPESPKVGDYFDVTSFVQEGQITQFREVLSRTGKGSHARVNERSWRLMDGELKLFLLLDFEDINTSSAEEAGAMFH